MIIRSFVGKPFLNSKTLSELSKLFFELHNVSSQTQNQGIRWFLWGLKLNTSVCGHRMTPGLFQTNCNNVVNTKLVRFERTWGRSVSANWNIELHSSQKSTDSPILGLRWDIMELKEEFRELGECFRVQKRLWYRILDRYRYPFFYDDQ